MSDFINTMFNTWQKLDPQVKDQIKQGVQSKIPQGVVQVGSVVNTFIRIANESIHEEQAQEEDYSQNDQNYYEREDVDDDDVIIDVEFVEIKES